MCVHCLPSCSWVPLRRVWLHRLYPLPQNCVFKYTDKTPSTSIPSSVLSSPSSLSLSVYTRCCKPLMFMALCPTHCSRYPSSLEKPSTRHGTPDVMRRGEDLLIQPAGNALPNAAQDTVGLGHKGTLLPQVNARIARTLQVLLHKATFQPVSPQLYGGLYVMFIVCWREAVHHLSWQLRHWDITKGSVCKWVPMKGGGPLHWCVHDACF